MYLIDMEWSGYINDWSQFQIIDNAPTVEVNTVIFTISFFMIKML